MADVIGRAIIEVAPDTTRFGQRLTRDLRKLTSGFKKISVGVSVSSVSKAFREFTKLNLALRAATIGFAALGTKIVAGGFLLAADAALQLSGALAVLPAVGAAAAAAVGALKVGLFGVDDVVKAFLKGDMDKFNEKLKELSPNAQQALGVLREFKPALQDFKNAVQDALFAGLRPVFQDLGTRLLPLVKQGFVGITQEANLLVKSLASFATSKQSLADVSTIFGNIKTFFHTLVPASTAFATALRDIVTVGSSFLPQVAAVITVVATKFQQFIAHARETGQLKEFIGQGLDALGKLIDTVVNLVKTIGGVLSAARASGFGFLELLQDMSRRLEGFVNSTRGQDALGQFFGNLESAVNTLLPVLFALGRFFNNQFFPIVTKIADIIGPALVVFIDALGQAFEVARPGIEAFAEGVADFIKAIAPALPALGKLAGAIGQTLGQVLERIGPKLNDVIVALADAFTQAVSNPALVDGMVDLAKAIGDVVIALAPFIPKLVELAIKLLPLFVKALEALVPIIESLTPLVDALIKIVGPLVTILGGVVDFIGKIASVSGLLGLLSPALGLVALGVDAIKNAFSGSDFSFNVWIEGLTNVGGAAETMVGKLKHELVDKLPNTVLRPAGTFLQGFFTKVELIFSDSVNVVDQNLQAMIRVIFGVGPEFGAAGSAIGAEFERGLRSGFGAVLGAAHDLVGDVLAVLTNTNFGPAGAAVTSSFARGMTSLLGAVREASHAVAGAAGSALPRSPAEEGPFSGRGWTPFRGQALARGFADGIRSGLTQVRSASLQLASASAATFATSGVPTTRATPTPSVVVRSPQVSTTVDAPSVQVFLDGRELRGVVVKVVDERDRALRRSVQAGVGGAL